MTNIQCGDIKKLHRFYRPHYCRMFAKFLLPDQRQRDITSVTIQNQRQSFTTAKFTSVTNSPTDTSANQLSRIQADSPSPALTDTVRQTGDKSLQSHPPSTSNEYSPRTVNVENKQNTVTTRRTNKSRKSRATPVAQLDAVLHIISTVNYDTGHMAPYHGDS